MQKPYSDRKRSLLSSAGILIGLALGSAVPGNAQVIRSAAEDIGEGTVRGARFVGRGAVRTVQVAGGAAQETGRVVWRGGERVVTSDVGRGLGRGIVTVASVPVYAAGGVVRVITAPFGGLRGRDRFFATDAGRGAFFYATEPRVSTRHYVRTTDPGTRDRYYVVVTDSRRRTHFYDTDPGLRSRYYAPGMDRRRVFYTTTPWQRHRYYMTVPGQRQYFYASDSGQRRYYTLVSGQRHRYYTTAQGQRVVVPVYASSPIRQEVRSMRFTQG